MKGEYNKIESEKIEEGRGIVIAHRWDGFEKYYVIARLSMELEFQTFVKDILKIIFHRYNKTKRNM